MTSVVSNSGPKIYVCVLIEINLSNYGNSYMRHYNNSHIGRAAIARGQMFRDRLNAQVTT